MAQFVMNDQQVMDLLEEKMDEDAAAFFGECLDEECGVQNVLPSSATCSRYIAKINNALQELGVDFRAVELLEVTPDDGYTWVFETLETEE